MYIRMYYIVLIVTENSRFWFSYSTWFTWWKALYHVWYTKLYSSVSHVLVRHVLVMWFLWKLLREIAGRGAHGLESDVWSLGCMLYTMLVGKPPFDVSLSNYNIHDTHEYHYRLTALRRHWIKWYMVILICQGM